MKSRVQTWYSASLAHPMQRLFGFLVKLSVSVSWLNAYHFCPTSLQVLGVLMLFKSHGLPWTSLPLQLSLKRIKPTPSYYPDYISLEPIIDQQFLHTASFILIVSIRAASLPFRGFHSCCVHFSALVAFKNNMRQRENISAVRPPFLV